MMIHADAFVSARIDAVAEQELAGQAVKQVVPLVARHERSTEAAVHNLAEKTSLISRPAGQEAPK